MSYGRSIFGREQRVVIGLFVADETTLKNPLINDGRLFCEYLRLKNSERCASVMYDYI